MPGGVHAIVTLDPAAHIAGGYDPTAFDEVDFARDSFFSWSFHSSSLGNEYTPATADESFIVEKRHGFDQCTWQCGLPLRLHAASS